MSVRLRAEAILCFRFSSMKFGRSTLKASIHSGCFCEGGTSKKSKLNRCQLMPEQERRENLCSGVRSAPAVKVSECLREKLVIMPCDSEAGELASKRPMRVNSALQVWVRGFSGVLSVANASAHVDEAPLGDTHISGKSYSNETWVSSRWATWMSLPCSMTTSRLCERRRSVYPIRYEVRMLPLPLTEISPRSSSENMPGDSFSWVDGLTWILPGAQVLSIRDAVLTVSPTSLYRGHSRPTTPARSFPEFRPMRTLIRPSSMNRCKE
mmetsp:Transcript_22873/g.68752  ORF Transcript_22873/g.68752 Transcript_22873/m.68752 type:complete len:267 (-) Transcript_22873:1431-2231(-)